MVVQFFQKSKTVADQQQYKEILGVHVITKTLQIAPVFTLVFFPLARVFKYKPNFKKVMLGSTFLSGALCTGGLVKTFMKSSDEELK